jgi:hypothetical protein
MKKYETSIPQVTELQQQPAEDTRRHLFTTAAGVILPLLQALATGLIVFVLAGFYAWLLRSPVWWKWGAVIAGAVVLVTWLVMLWRWLSLTRPLEQITGIDLNRDGHIGPPPVVKVQLTSEDKRYTQIVEIPYPDRLPILARGLLGGRPVSEREWSGHRKLYSQHEWLAVRSVLESRGLIRLKNRWEPRRGFELSPSGRAMMAKFASPSPTPDAYDVQIADQ